MIPLSTIILCRSSYKGKLWGKTIPKTVSTWTHNIEWPHICLSIKILALQSYAEEPACKIKCWKPKVKWIRKLISRYLITSQYKMTSSSTWKLWSENHLVEIITLFSLQPLSIFLSQFTYVQSLRSWPIDSLFFTLLPLRCFYNILNIIPGLLLPLRFETKKFQEGEFS